MADAIRGGAAMAPRQARRAGALAAILTAAAGVAAVASVSAPSAAEAATVQRADRAPQSSNRFTVTNLSQYTLKLVKATGKWEGRPADGSTIAPGYDQGWEVKFVLASDTTDTAQYNVLDGTKTLGQLNTSMTVGAFRSLTASCQVLGEPLIDIPGTCSHSGATITFSSKPVTYTVTDPAAQAAVLNQDCGGAPNFSCTFDPVSQQFVLGPSHQSGPAYANDTSGPITKKITVTEKVTSSQNVELTANAKLTIGKAVEAGISTKYGKTQANEHTYTEETTLTILPHTKIWPEVQDPLTIYTGTFAIRLGNTTWDLPGVAATYPNPDGFPTISWKEADI